MIRLLSAFVIVLMFCSLANACPPAAEPVCGSAAIESLPSIMVADEQPDCCVQLRVRVVERHLLRPVHVTARCGLCAAHKALRAPLAVTHRLRVHRTILSCQ